MRRAFLLCLLKRRGKSAKTGQMSIKDKNVIKCKNKSKYRCMRHDLCDFCEKTAKNVKKAGMFDV